MAPSMRLKSFWISGSAHWLLPSMCPQAQAARTRSKREEYSFSDCSKISPSAVAMLRRRRGIRRGGSNMAVDGGVVGDAIIARNPFGAAPKEEILPDGAPILVRTDRAPAPVKAEISQHEPRRASCARFFRRRDFRFPLRRLFAASTVRGGAGLRLAMTHASKVRFGRRRSKSVCRTGG